MDLCCSRILNVAELLPLWKQPLWLCEMLMEMATMILCRQGEKGKSRSNGVQMKSTLPLDVEFFQWTSRPSTTISTSIQIGELLDGGCVWLEWHQHRQYQINSCRPDTTHQTDSPWIQEFQIPTHPGMSSAIAFCDIILVWLLLRSWIFPNYLVSMFGSAMNYLFHGHDWLYTTKIRWSYCRCIARIESRHCVAVEARNKGTAEDEL